MRRTLYFAASATASLRHIDRRFVPGVWATLKALAENPDTVLYYPNPRDPSIYGITISGDVTIWFEILDELHALRILDIEE